MPRRRAAKHPGVVSLAERRLEPIPEVVDALEHLLEQAQSGELRGFASSFVLAGGYEGYSYSVGDSTVSGLVAGVERCKLSMLLPDFVEDE